ncbi:MULTISPECIES: adenylate/guanylate cyclase domain-containing protein [unclassified Acinetobacter]|uniref:adenylate/guanylate cyclase domain-containing protein n=1 Tax=unclassified Acinetobacter TaxID=196816 RepID=UPI0035B6BF5A
MDNIFNKSSYQFKQVSRIFAYLSLSLLVGLAFILEPNVHLHSFLAIPIVASLLFFESKYLNKIGYHYGRKTRNDFSFFNDVLIAGIFIAALHAKIIPSLIIIAGLFFIAIVGRVNKVFIYFSPLVLLFGFYTFFLISDLPKNLYFTNSTSALSIISIVLLLMQIIINNYYQNNRFVEINEQNKRYEAEIEEYFRLNNQLARYAPEQVWQSIAQGEIKAKIEYKRRKLTVFFSDIEGFTDLSEKLIPDDLAFLLNDYLKHMTEIAKHYGATVDKFMGDGLLLFFGDPNSRGVKADAIACIDMAVAMQQQMRILRERWAKMGFTSLHIRIGIATGYCHVGNYGTTHRMAYTIIGRDANLSARLQAAAEAGQIFVSEETFNLIKDTFLCVKNQPLRLKGINEVVQSWQVVERYDVAIERYHRWYDYEYKGFNLMVNLDKVQAYEYEKLIEAMEKTITRIKIQKERTDLDGAVPLSKDSIVRINKNRIEKDD